MSGVILLTYGEFLKIYKNRKDKYPPKDIGEEYNQSFTKRSNERPIDTFFKSSSLPIIK